MIDDDDDILDNPNKGYEGDTMIIKWNKIQLTGFFANITNIVLILWVIRVALEFGIWCYENYPL